jgi:hypothetical protein
MTPPSTRPPIPRRSAPGLVLVLLAALALTPLTGRAASAADGASDVFIVQGVPESEVDVVIDDRPIESSVRTATVVGPVALQPGSHTATFSTGEWTVTKSFDVTGPSVDVVLHWPPDPAQQPVTTVFTNDISPVADGKGRLTVAHTAVVPPADVRVDGKVLFANIANGEFVTADVPADTYPVDIVATGSSSPLLGPVDLEVAAGALTRVFAIGQPSAGSMDAIVQVVSLGRGGSDRPTSVRAGSAGLVAPGHEQVRSGTQPSGLVIGVLAGVLVAGVLLTTGLRRALR